MRPVAPAEEEEDEHLVLSLSSLAAALVFHFLTCKKAAAVLVAAPAILLLLLVKAKVRVVEDLQVQPVLPAVVVAVVKVLAVQVAVAQPNRQSLPVGRTFAMVAS